MIYKSYIVENNLNILKEKVVLFYGENIGLISDIKKRIKTIYSNCEILSYDQDDVLKNTEAVFSDVINISLFSQKKIYLISQVSDKLLNFVEDNVFGQLFITDTSYDRCNNILSKINIEHEIFQIDNRK